MIEPIENNLNLKTFAEEYLKLLSSEYSSINLTNIKEPKEFFLKQIVDSVFPFLSFKEVMDSVEKAPFVVDVGFGGGFPILPLAVLFPDKKFVGIEARSKKVKVVGEIASLLGIKNASFYHSRIEDVLFDKEELMLTFKAVGKAESFLEKVNVKTDSACNFRVTFLKGPSYEKDEGFYGNGLWDLEFNQEYSLGEPGKGERLDRRILMFNIAGETTKKTKNKLVRFSQIIEKF